MTVLLDKEFPRTLDVLVREAATTGFGSVEAWLFEDEAARREAEAELGRRGIRARFHSAYKPLVHWLLEDLDRTGLKRIEIRYPRHADAPQRRFLLEAYPLAAMLKDVEVAFEAGAAAECPSYAVRLVRADGSVETVEVRAPNRVHADPTGSPCLSPTGWLVVRDASGGLVRDERIETDYEALYASTVSAVAGHDWGEVQPFFEQLCIRADLPAAECSLAYDEEVVSLQEALHEDLYFSCLELFRSRLGLAADDRGLQPGQIVPDIRRGEGAPRLTLTLEPLDRGERSRPDQTLATAEVALAADQVGRLLADIEGRAFAAGTRAGRTVQGRYHAGSDPAVIVSGGQHANETSGVIGALRAGQILAGRPGSHFALIALENPDGYALHQRLTQQQRFHMHHAARYTALGDDVEARQVEPLHERAARAEAERLSGARLHVNLHGYPAHEWTRPLSGYIPRGFEMWTVPKGFFLIMRHHAAWADHAARFIDAVTQRLSANADLVAFNARQIALFERHAGATNFDVVNGFPCLISTDERHGPPLTLITEFPDETIEGEAFVFAHTAQMATVLAAYEAHRALMSADAPRPPDGQTV